MNRNRLFGIVVIFIVSFFLTGSTTFTEQGSHCYAVITPVNTESDEYSQVTEIKCFDSFSDSIYAATQGHVQLEKIVHPESVTDEILNYGNGENTLDSQIVIGIDWDYSGYWGASYTWVSTSGTGCTSTISFNRPTMPSNWDNRVSSARGYSGCNYFYHYANTNFGGASIACSTSGCSSMGAINNATSSEKWRYNP
mgnify:CR=1 FL=1